jgi:hypothetical protein
VRESRVRDDIRPSDIFLRLEGVGVCCDLAACNAGRFDLIVNSNVLEHVGFPRVLAEQFTSIAAPGTMAFIEVPCELPFSGKQVFNQLRA